MWCGIDNDKLRPLVVCLGERLLQPWGGGQVNTGGGCLNPGYHPIRQHLPGGRGQLPTPCGRRPPQLRQGEPTVWSFLLRLFG